MMLLSERQLKTAIGGRLTLLTLLRRFVQLAGMGLLPEGAARLGRYALGRHTQPARRPEGSELHAMAEALVLATDAFRPAELYCDDKAAAPEHLCMGGTT